MQASIKDPICPTCLHGDVVEHIEAASVESCVKGADPRRSVDLIFLSLIALDRRKSETDRRGIDSANIIVEH